MEVELSPANHHFEILKTVEEDDSVTKLDKNIKKIAEREGFIKYKVDKRCLTTNGGNYLGMLYEVDVKGRTADGEKTLNIFVKNIVQSENLKIVRIADVFDTEIFAYKELSKLFNELQDEADVPQEERYKMAKFYEESDTEAIIMENVTKRGFGTFNRLETASLKFVELSIVALAKFHSLSFVIEKRKPEFFEKKIKKIRYPMIYEEDWRTMVKNLKECVVNHVQEHYKEKIANYYDEVETRHGQYYGDDSIRACLCHGDYRPNNIMTKMQNDEPHQIIPVDYQTMNYGSPVFDFLYFIYASTDREFRTAHMDNLKNLYFDTMSEFLAYFNLDAEVVYPREEFEKVYKEKLDIALITALVLLPFMLADENNVPDISKEVAEVKFSVDASYTKRIREIVDEFVEWGFL